MFISPWGLLRVCFREAARESRGIRQTSITPHVLCYCCTLFISLKCEVQIARFSDKRILISYASHPVRITLVAMLFFVRVASCMRSFLSIYYYALFLPSLIPAETLLELADSFILVQNINARRIPLNRVCFEARNSFNQTSLIIIDAPQ